MSNIQNAYNWLKIQKLIFWRIENTSNEVFFRYPASDDDAPALKESLDTFEQIIQDLPKGIYRIKGRAKDNQRAQEVSFPLVLEQQGQQTGSNNFDNVALEAVSKIQQDFETYKRQIEIERLKNEYELKLAQAKQQQAPKDSSRLDKVLEMLAINFLPQIMQGAPAPAKVSGVPAPVQQDAEESELESQNREVLQDALSALQTVFAGDFLVVMHKLGLLATKKPDVLKNIAGSLDMILNS